MSRSSVNWEQVATRLREVRGDSTQTNFGKALGVMQHEVSRYELGRVHPPVEYLVAAAKYAGVTLDWLIVGDRPKARPAGKTSA